MLVLVPTRELALQVAATCRLVQKLTGLRTACIYGGVSKEQQVGVVCVGGRVSVCVCVGACWWVGGGGSGFAGSGARGQLRWVLHPAAFTFVPIGDWPQ